jgi:hypothetical protein
MPIHGYRDPRALTEPELLMERNAAEVRAALDRLGLEALDTLQRNGVPMSDPNGWVLYDWAFKHLSSDGVLSCAFTPYGAEVDPADGQVKKCSGALPDAARTTYDDHLWAAIGKLIQEVSTSR